MEITTNGLNIILFFDIYNSIPRNVNIFTATVYTSINLLYDSQYIQQHSIQVQFTKYFRVG